MDVSQSKTNISINIVETHLVHVSVVLPIVRRVFRDLCEFQPLVNLDETFLKLLGFLSCTLQNIK